MDARLFNRLFCSLLGMYMLTTVVSAQCAVNVPLSYRNVRLWQAVDSPADAVKNP